MALTALGGVVAASQGSALSYTPPLALWTPAFMTLYVVARIVYFIYYAVVVHAATSLRSPTHYSLSLAQIEAALAGQS